MVVDLPAQVGHVIKYRPFLAVNTCFFTLSAIFENINSSSCLAELFIFLITIPILPVFRYAFTL
ncbi:MAG: hypothetical protein WCG25_06815 [bacterium]